MPRKDKEARKAYEAARYQKNRAKIIARVTAYALKNKERVRAASRKRYRKDPAKVNARNLAWRAANPEKAQKMQRAAWRKHMYGITALQLEKLLDAQNGKCAISTCSAVLTMVGRFGGDVDHDHVTGVVRGLLCHACNVGLGQFKDDPTKLIAAAEYLQKSFPVLMGEAYATAPKSGEVSGASTTPVGVSQGDAS